MRWAETTWRAASPSAADLARVYVIYSAPPPWPWARCVTGSRSRSGDGQRLTEPRRYLSAVVITADTDRLGVKKQNTTQNIAVREALGRIFCELARDRRPRYNGKVRMGC